MIAIDASNRRHEEINQTLRDMRPQAAAITHCMGQRYIAAGMRNVNLRIEGTPGNALGCFLDGGIINVYGNAQDAVGDTMSSGQIMIHGDCGDTLGYAMRGGRIFVKGDVGYRAGIHMKQHESQQPYIVIGGSAGCFLGEYQAGGTILVLGIGHEDAVPVGAFCATGMHGGKIYIRSMHKPPRLPAQVKLHPVQSEEEQAEISALIHSYCNDFDMNEAELLKSHYWCLQPDDDNPYHHLYTPN